jgi:hypothetical protein
LITLTTTKISGTEFRLAFIWSSVRFVNQTGWHVSFCCVTWSKSGGERTRIVCRSSQATRVRITENEQAQITVAENRGMEGNTSPLSKS